VTAPMSFADYLSIPAVNWSSLKKLAISPLHYLHHIDSPPTPATDAMIIGSATHKAVLEPEDFGSEYTVWTGARRAGKEWDAFCAANAGKEILREQDVDRVQALALSVQRHPGCARYLDGPGVNELTIRWNDLPTGIACKGRADRVGPLRLRRVRARGGRALRRPRGVPRAAAAAGRVPGVGAVAGAVRGRAVAGTARVVLRG
jgi:hypothetical protein